MNHVSFYCRLVLVMLCLLPATGRPQDYRVLHVKGKACRGEAMKEIAVGDQLKADEKVLFSSADATVVVLSREGKRYTLKAGPKKERKENEGMSLIRDMLQPSTAYLSTRALPSFPMIPLHLFFRKESILVLDGRLSFRFDAYNYPEAPGNTFSLLCADEESNCSLPLHRSGDTLLLSAVAPACPCNNFMAVFSEGNEHYAICQSAFSVVFLGKEELRASLVPLIATLQQNQQDTNSIIAETQAFLSECYGYAEYYHVAAFLQLHFLH